MTDREAAAEAVAEAHRREWGRVLAATVRITRDLDLAEECVQDAYARALTSWARDGVPDAPGSWLTTTSRRRALDLLRREATLRRKLPLLVDDIGGPGPVDAAAESIPDDRLRLVFTCCHPALAVESRVALTLRLLCGLTTAEVARAFLVQESTMAARITRAKKKIAAARIPYRVPAAPELPERLDGVLTVVHLLFTTGHVSPTGDALTRNELADRAIDLARTVRTMLPDQPAADGLLALLLLTDARRPTRSAPDGRLLLLEEQDRARWDHAAISEGVTLLERAADVAQPDRYLLQARIAAAHATAPTYADTDWTQIVTAYDQLLTIWPSPVVALNRAVAVAMRDGPATGLALLDELVADPQLSRYGYLPAARADLLRRLERIDDARVAYQAALRLTENSVERRFLVERLDELASGEPRPAAG